MDSINEFLYFGGVIAAGIVGWYLLTTILSRTEQIRIDRIQKQKRFEPIRSGSPVKDHTEKARDRALESLGTRFSIIRRTFLSLLVLLWLVLAAAPFLDNFSTGLISVFGAAGAVLVGVAARPFLENVIAGYVVTFSKQFRTGDTIRIDEQYGTIEDITPTHTVVKLWDWRRYVVPNGSMLTKEVINYTNRESLLWSKLEFYVAYEADLDAVREIAVQAGRENPHFAGQEDPKMWVMGMEKEGVLCWLAMWTKSPADAWSIRVEVGEAIVRKLIEKGIHTHSFKVHTGKAETWS